MTCANITLPHGTLFDCYDELGNRYQLPIYVLSAPINLIESEQSSMDSRADFGSATSIHRAGEDEGNRNISSSSSSSSSSASSSFSATSLHNDRHHPILRRLKKHRQKAKPQSDHLTTEIPIKFRLSNGKEHRLWCKPNEKIRSIKKRLTALENGAIDSQVQRFFFGGQLLRKISSSTAISIVALFSR